MNDEQPTLFLGNDLLGLSTLVFLVDPMTNTFWHRVIWHRVIPNDNYHGQIEKLNQQIAGLHTVEFRTSPDAEQTLFMAFSLFCKDLSKAYELYEYASYIKRSRKPAADTGMRAVMWQSGSQLFNDTFVVNTETGDYWNGNLITTVLKELNMTLTGAKRSRRFQSYLENYPTLLKGRFGERHVTVLKDETGALTRFYAETDRFTRELKLKEIDNKAEKMTLAEFLERYDNKENKE